MISLILEGAGAVITKGIGDGEAVVAITTTAIGKGWTLMDSRLVGNLQRKSDLISRVKSFHKNTR